MVLPTASWADVALIMLTIVVLWVPGAAVLLAAGARAWWLAAGAPLVTYGLAGLGGPVLSGLGLPWQVWALPLLAVVAVAVAFGVRRLCRAETPASPPWQRVAHGVVASCVVLAAAIGALAVLVGISTLRAIPQDWDAVFHANGIRYIVDTGDGGLAGMSQVNWYGTDSSQYYPNAYHLVAATVTSLSGRDIPSVLNANTLLLPGIAALGLATLVHRLGGRAVTAGASALVFVGITAFYDMLWRGPLLPFAMGVALVPALLVILTEYLRPASLVGRTRAIVPLALATAGLIGLHPGALITAAVFAATMVIARWIASPRSAPTEALSLLLGGAVAVAAVVPHVLGSLQSAAESSNDWPAVSTAPEALGEVLLFGTAATSLQLWIAVALALGVATSLRLGPLRWLLVPAGLFVILYVLASASDAPLVETITRPWWNDRFRLVGIAALPLAVVAAHGLAETASVLRGYAIRLLSRVAPRRATFPAAATAAIFVVVGYLVVTGGSYLGRNEVRMQANTGNGPAVSQLELAGFQVLGRLVPAGERVMNDRGDGSAWMYAMAGVRPVAGHYYGNGVDPDATLLAERFNAYDDDPAVRAAAARLDVHWVVVDQGFLRPDGQRQPGLVGLDRVPSLRIAYSNPDMVLYRLGP